MIARIFGEPNYPTILKNGKLIINDEKQIQIGDVYLFDKNHYLKLLKFGELWVNNWVISKRRTVGYFYCNDFQIFMIDGARKIVADAGNEITYELRRISFNKNHIENNSGDVVSIIKFKAQDITTIFKK
jgi:hypothetical protein